MKVIYGKSALKFKADKIPPLLDEQVNDGDMLYAKKRGLIISDPGYGKTFTALSGLVQVIRDRGNVRTCIFVPSIAAFQWAVATTSFLLHQGLGNRVQIQVVRSGNDDIDEDTTILIVTYGMVSQKTSKLPAKIRFWSPVVLICDEYETMSNIEAERTKVILGTEDVQGLVDFAEWKWMLTGTPIPRYNDGLYPVLNALYPAVLDSYGVLSYKAFVEEFCYTKLVRYPGMLKSKLTVAGSRNGDILHTILYDGCGAVRRKLVLSVDYIERTVLTDFKPSAELRKLTLELMAQEGMQVDEYGNPVGEPSTGMAEAMKLIAVEKAPSVASYLMQQMDEKANRGDKRGIVALYWHTEAGQAIVDALNRNGYPAELLSGADDAQAKHAKAEMLNNGDIDIIVGQIEAMGKAVNMQKNCNHVVFAERDWSHSRQLQSLQRVFRRGQEDNVFVDFCQSTNPLELPKVRVVARKKAGAGKVLDQ